MNYYQQEKLVADDKDFLHVRNAEHWYQFKSSIKALTITMLCMI